MIPPLTVVDEGALRPDLTERGETKYGFMRHDVGTLRSVLRRAATPITHAGPVSTVRSIYFDDIGLGACFANLDGLGVRHKMRLRWYDEESPSEDCFFEVKWRRNQATGKHRFRVREGAALAKAPLHDLPHAMAKALPARFEHILEKAQQAVVLVEYRREHFALGDTRFTLDYDIRFYPLLGRQHLVRRFAERLLGFALIECKAPLSGQKLEQRALRSLGARPMRFSKYVTGCQSLGYVANI